jgi:hypothetical protein
MTNVEVKIYDNVPGVATKVTEIRLTKYHERAITSDTFVLERKPYYDKMATFDNSDDQLQQKKIWKTLQSMLKDQS